MSVERYRLGIMLGIVGYDTLLIAENVTIEEGRHLIISDDHHHGQLLHTSGFVVSSLLCGTNDRGDVN